MRQPYAVTQPQVERQPHVLRQPRFVRLSHFERQLCNAIKVKACVDIEANPNVFCDISSLDFSLIRATVP